MTKEKLIKLLDQKSIDDLSLDIDVIDYVCDECNAVLLYIKTITTTGFKYWITHRTRYDLRKQATSYFLNNVKWNKIKL